MTETGKKERKKRPVLCRYGARGDQVKAVVDGDVVVIYYRDAERKPRKKILPNDRDGRQTARDWCAAYHGERERIAKEERERKAAKPPITHRELWEAYTAAPAWADLRKSSQINYGPRWRKWERFRGPDTPVNQTTLLHIDQYITAAREAGMAINQIRQVLNVARVVYNYGVTRDLIPPNKLSTYRWKRPKDAEVLEPEEYTEDEFMALLRVTSPQNARTWRLWVALMIAGHHGQRANAVLHLRWEDIKGGASILWPSEWQKNGQELEQPLTWEAVAALETARYWLRVPEGRSFSRMNHRQRIAADMLARSPWVLPSHGDPDKPYTYQAMWRALMAAEQRANVEHKEYRALHGFRRKVAGDVGDRTGDSRLAMEWIGDRDMKQATNYLKRRAERLDRAAAAISNGGRPK